MRAKTIILSVLFLLAGFFKCPAADQMQVRVESGLLEGVPNATRDVTFYKGIPYAAPPVGKLRWQEPQAAANWEGVRKADKFGPSCMQPVSSNKPPYTAEFCVNDTLDEDCLYLNIWSPAKTPNDKLAVLFYIHGGAGVVGSGSVPIYDGEALAKKGIVVVTVNFRLGLLAGFGHPELTAESAHKSCGNYGMLDQIAALKWVQKNIAAFGGDPEKVTICGQSAGAAAVHHLVLSPLCKGLFRAAIAASGGPDGLLQPSKVPTVALKEEHGLTYAKLKNASNLEALRKLPAVDIKARDPIINEAKLTSLGPTVVQDNWSLTTQYPEALDKGLENDVPMMLGLTADDSGPPVKFSKLTAATFAEKAPTLFGRNKDAFASIKEKYFALNPVTSDTEACEVGKRTQTEYGMAAVHFWAKRRAKGNKSPVYSYIFEQPIPWPEHPEYGAFHSSDLVYFFNNLSKLDRPWTDTDRRVADQASTYWVNFVKTLNPNGDGLPEWKPFDAIRTTTMSLSVQSGPREIAPKERLELYGAVLEK